MKRFFRFLAARPFVLLLISAAVVTLLALIVLAAVLSLTKEEEQNEIPPVSYSFYEPDYSADILEDEDYLPLFRGIYYTDENGVTYTIDSENDADYTRYGEEILLFKKYFDALRNGDADAVNSFYTAAYTENAPDLPYERISMQRIYDVKVEYNSSGESGGVENTAFLVKFKIMKNDGTFRTDIESDRELTLGYKLIESEDTLKIDQIISILKNTAS